MKPEQEVIIRSIVFESFLSGAPNVDASKSKI